MRSEKEIRQYRDALKWALIQPCNCAASGHEFECRMGGLTMSDAIRTLTWVLGESEELGDRVETFVAAHMRGSAHEG